MTIILAIDGNDNNWYDLFEDVETQDGSPIQIEQTLWKNLSIASPILAVSLLYPQGS